MNDGSNLVASDAGLTDQELFQTVKPLVPDEKRTEALITSFSVVIPKNHQKALDDLCREIEKPDHPKKLPNYKTFWLYPKEDHQTEDDLHDQIFVSAQNVYFHMMSQGEGVVLPFVPRQEVRQISRIDYIQNRKLQAEFEAQREAFKAQNIPTNELEFFHGTNPIKIDSILSQNFDLAAKPHNRQKASAYGKGIYFSQYPSIADAYGKLILCRVLPGRVEEVSRSTGMTKPLIGNDYDSRKVIGMTNNEDETVGNSVIHIIKNPSQILPYCVIHLKDAPFRPTATAPSTMSVLPGMTAASIPMTLLPGMSVGMPSGLLYSGTSTGSTPVSTANAPAGLQQVSANETKRQRLSWHVAQHAKFRASSAARDLFSQRPLLNSASNVLPQPSHMWQQPSTSDIFKNFFQPTNNYVALPQSSTYSALPQPSTSNQLLQPSTSNQLPQPSTSATLARPTTYDWQQPSTSNQLSQPRTYNPFGQPRTSNQLPQPSTYNPFAQPSTYNLFAQPSTYNPFAQPSTSNPSIATSGLNDLIDFSAFPINLGHDIEGPQPNRGTMEVDLISANLSGYPSDTKTYKITYNFPPGIQGPEHPNPGQPYVLSHFPRIAYLPADDDGLKVLGLLYEAFERRLIFTVSTSATSGIGNSVTWADIPHKTHKAGGGAFGYPDPDYIKTVLEKLKEKGIEPVSFS